MMQLLVVKNFIKNTGGNQMVTKIIIIAVIAIVVIGIAFFIRKKK